MLKQFANVWKIKKLLCIGSEQNVMSLTNYLIHRIDGNDFPSEIFGHDRPDNLDMTGATIIFKRDLYPLFESINNISKEAEQRIKYLWNDMLNKIRAEAVQEHERQKKEGWDRLRIWKQAELIVRTRENRLGADLANLENELKSLEFNP